MSHCRAVALLLVGLGLPYLAGPLQAQSGSLASLRARPEVEEHLFVLYMLEDLDRRFWPAATTRDPVMLGQVVARQRVILSKMIRHLERSTGTESLVRLAAGYGKMLEQAKRLREDIDKSFLQHCRWLRAQDLQRANETALTIGQTMAHAYLAGDSPEQGLLKGLAAGYLKMLEQAPAAVADRVAARQGFESDLARLFHAAYPAISAHRQAFLADLRREVPALARTRNLALDNEVKDLEEKLAKELAAAPAGTREDLRAQHQRRLQRLVDLNAKKKWKDHELVIGGQVLDSAALRSQFPRDPFRVEHTFPMEPKEGREGVQEFLDQANALFETVLLVPEDRPYDGVRADLLARAGRLANQAGALDLGDAGLPTRLNLAPKSASRAVMFWRYYLVYEKVDANVNIDVLHNIVLAWAYAGRVPAAHRQLMLIGLGKVNRGGAEFWYDAARVCSMASDVRNSRLALERAVRLGFRDFDKAKVTPDLKNLRKSDTAGWFDRLMGG
jgi:hypothetical protein